MAAIWEIPQSVAYQKNVAYAFIKLSAKSHSFNILCTMDVLSCPTNNRTDHNIDIEYNKRLDHRRPCLEDDLTAGSNL